MSIKACTGSPNTFNTFKYFNIHHPAEGGDPIDLTTKQKTGGNGLDQNGQGIYGVIGAADEDGVRGVVESYAGKSGNIYEMEIDVDRFANEIESCEISVDDWYTIITTAMEKVDEFEGFPYQELYDYAHSLDEIDIEDRGALELVVEKLEQYISIDMGDIEDFDESYELSEFIVDALVMERPASQIAEELPYLDISGAIDDADSLWDMHILVSSMICTNSNGRKYYNSCYYDAVKEVLEDDNPIVAAKIPCDNGDVVVCFDLDKIKIVNRVDLSLEVKSDFESRLLATTEKLNSEASLNESDIDPKVTVTKRLTL